MVIQDGVKAVELFWLFVVKDVDEDNLTARQPSLLVLADRGVR